MTDTPTPVAAASERRGPFEVDTRAERIFEIRALAEVRAFGNGSGADMALRDLLALVDKQAAELARWEFNSRANMQYAAQNLTDRILKLQAFKDYVHQRLDEAGIPKEPNGEHSKAGCRVGDRLDIALALSARAEAAEARAERARAALEKIEGMSVPDQPAAFALSRETYLMRWVAKLRGVARDALLTAPPPTAGREG